MFSLDRSTPLLGGSKTDTTANLLFTSQTNQAKGPSRKGSRHGREESHTSDKHLRTNKATKTSSNTKTKTKTADKAPTKPLSRTPSELPSQSSKGDWFCSVLMSVA